MGMVGEPQWVVKIVFFLVVAPQLLTLLRTPHYGDLVLAAVPVGVAIILEALKPEVVVGVVVVVAEMLGMPETPVVLAVQETLLTRRLKIAFL